MSDLTALTLAQARDLLRKREFSAVALTNAHMAAMGEARTLNAFVLETPDHAQTMAVQADAALARGDAGPLAGIPLGIKDMFCNRRACGPRPARTSSTASCRPMNRPSPPTCGEPARSCWASSTSTNSPWARRTRPRVFGPVISPWRRAGFEREARARAARRAVRPRRSRPICASAPPAPTPAARSASRRPSPASSASSRPMAAARAGASSPSPRRSTRPARSPARCEDAAILLRAMAGHDAKDSTVGRSAGAGLSRRRWARSVKGLRIGIPKEYRVDRHAGRDRGVVAARALTGCKDAGAEVGRGLAAAHQIRPAGLLHHGARRGLVQPRPL